MQLRHASVTIMLSAALAGCPGGGAPQSPDDDAPPTTATQAAPMFRTLDDAALASFEHDPGFHGMYRLQEIMGSGAAIFDMDSDGLLDIYLVNGDRAASDRPAGGDMLLRQRDAGSFDNITEASGITPHGFGMGCATGDYDNDGDVDLLLTGAAQLQLFRNDGKGAFTDVSAAVGLVDQPWCVAAAFTDIDGDGWLDLFVVNYVQPDDAQRCFDKAGRREFCGPQHYQPLPDVLYRNERGTFRDVSEESGIAARRGPGLGVMCVDFTGDRLVDVYVANDAAANFLWVNQGDGTFVERAAQLGGAYNREGAAQASMGVALGDVNDDGGLDLFMTHLDSETNTLYRIAADGTFADVTALTGLGPPSLPYTGFGTAMLDADHDGDLDIVVVNGAIKRRQRLFDDAVGAEELRPYAEPRQLFVNDGTGSFSAVEGAAAGLGPIEAGRGLAVGDINRDGALDLLATNAGSAPRLLLGTPPAERSWLIIRAFDPQLKRDALGAKVTIRAGGNEFTRHILSSYSYASSHDPVAHFGLGSATHVDDVIVHWPDGSAERFPGPHANLHVQFDRGMGEPLTP